MKALARKNWFWISVATLLVLALQALNFSPIYQVDHAIYDAGLSSVHKSAGEAENVVIISIDKSDLEQPENRLSLKEGVAQLLGVIKKAGSQSVTLMVPLQDEQPLYGSKQLAEMESFIQSSSISKQDKRSLEGLVSSAREEMNVDGRISSEVGRLNRVYFPFHVMHDAKPVFTHGLPLAKLNGEAASPLLSFLEEPKIEKTVVYEHAWPIESLLMAGKGAGYLSFQEDSDGVIRSLPLTVMYQKEQLASLPLLLAAKELGLSIHDLKVQDGKKLHLGQQATLPLDENNNFYPSYYLPSGGESLFKRFGFAEVMSEDFSIKELKKKIILVEAPDFLPSTTVHTPIGEASSAAEVLGHAVASILNRDVYNRPAALQWVELTLLLGVVLYLILLLPRLGLSSGFFVTLFSALAMIGAEFYFLLSNQSWLHVGNSIVLLLLGYLIVTAQYAFNMQRTRHQQDISLTNRQLGLLLQEQGKLEQAFECFQKLPSSIDHLDMIYNLALDFERKRKFNNAARVFHYIHEQKSGFRDVDHRMKRAEQMEQTTTLGTGQFHNLGSLLEGETGEKPMLGRFVVERELGKGAMGAVYLGRDPKIDRKVAIKTLALAREFESDEIKEVEERFFHEASAAGRLNHPNIVTIYDAAEDHDLAYIAMEYIEGKPLSDYATVKKLLPIEVVLNIVAKTADALEYAGKEGIVHRDIKPANIMYNEADDTVKITDFGIARISSSGRTKTGMILGTPSYMSPEQMNGKHVDTRSDIFSLGVTMFVLLSGHKPFAGDSLAAISYKIVNDKHPDITEIRKGLPDCVKKVIDKALQKNPDKRYQSGIVMKRAVMRCLKEVAEGDS